METLTNLVEEDVAYCYKRLPKKVKNLMSIAQVRGIPPMIVAGGFIRSVLANEPINDIDIFMSSSTDASEFANMLNRDLGGSITDVVGTENAYTVRSCNPVVQFVHRWTFNTPSEVVQSFDFTIAAVALFLNTIGDPDSCCSSRFYSDLAARRLIYRHPKRNEDAGGSMLRVIKFLGRGYRIPLYSMAGVMARMTGSINYHKLDPALGLRDEIAITAAFCGMFNEVDPSVAPSSEFINNME